jgi:hypothetical protein
LSKNQSSSELNYSQSSAKLEETMRIMDWNIEHMNSWWKSGDLDLAVMRGSFEGNNFAPPITDVPNLAARVANVIKSVDPDLITIQEGAGMPEMRDFFNRLVTGDWKILRGAGGAQALVVAARLDRDISAMELGPEVVGGIDLTLPFNADINSDLLVDEVGFARQPQVVTISAHGQSFMVVNNHLKSKFVRNGQAMYNAGGIDRLTFFSDALNARRRISAEAFRIRAFIDAVLADNPHALVIVTGDLNDGEGADYFEENFLTHSVVDRIFGSVFRPERQLQHALFASGVTDYTARFFDFIENETKALVIDHIGLSPAISKDWHWQGRVAVAEYEDQIRDDTQVNERDRLPSDHRPVVLEITPLA